MEKDLTIKFEIEIPLHYVIGAPGLTFHRWLPNESDSIIIDKDSYRVILYFDENCTSTSKSEYSRQVNVICSKVKCEYIAKKVKNILIDFYKNNISSINESDAKIIDEAKIFAQNVFINFTTLINRLIKYTRINKGQYWLEDVFLDIGNIEQYFNKWKAQASETPDDKKSWFRWRPIHSTSIKCILPNESTYINQQDWVQIRQFISSNARLSFSKELISKSRLLESYGYRRNSLVDLIIALEIALSNFCNRPNISSLNNDFTFLNNVDLNGLRNTLSHLGFSTTIKYLIPIIFPSYVFEKDLINTVSEAIDQRNNVVHNGQKDIDEKKLIEYICKVEKLVDVLDKYTK